jgi:lysophospholipase L1-like esterase
MAAGSGGTSEGGTGGAVAGTGGQGGSGGAALADVTVFIAGDSTVSDYADTASPSDQAGWGQMLPEIFSDQVTVDNRAAGGRTARWFHLEGAAQGILDDAAPGDYLFVQFGTNDSHETATFEVGGTTYQRYAEAGTTFKQHLLDYYITPGRAASLVVVLVTPPPRNSAYCGTGNSLGGYAMAMRELGESEDVQVLDLNGKTFDHLAAICPAPTPEDFFAFRSDGTVDGTHFQENGARHMANFLGECISEIQLGLLPYLLP